jgi:hypothetical protein
MNIGNMHVLSKNNEFDTISENLRNRAKQDGRLLNAFGKTTMDLEKGQQKSDIHLEPELKPAQSRGNAQVLAKKGKVKLLRELIHPRWRV